MKHTTRRRPFNARYRRLVLRQLRMAGEEEEEEEDQ
jgi:hypothetical protein